MEAAETSLALEPELIVATFLPSTELSSHNPAWESVFGGAQQVWDRLPVQDRPLIRSYLTGAAAGKMATNRLFMVKHPARDQPLPVLLHFLPVVLPRGESASTAAVIVTGEVLAEPTSWMLSQTERHRMETLGRMTMGIIHDFNNLLSAILGHTELLKRIAAEEPHFEVAREHLATMETASLDGAALVRKIQQYLRQERDREFEVVDLRRIIEDSVALTRPYWYNEPRRQGIQIDTVTEFEDIPSILGAPSELRDVFVNLILNAVQALPQGGHIAIRTAVGAEGQVRVEFSDNGTGMTDRVRARIFEPMFTTKGKRGTGMGLAVCYSTVQEHDGDITVDTSLGFGTTFTLTFPPAAARLSETASTKEDMRRRSARILVVDDEPMVRNVIAKLMSRRGHEVVEAGSGPEAIQRCKDRHFDIVFTDQGMPDMSGRELASNIRKFLPETPIVLLTGDTDAGEPDRSVTLVLTKPCRSEALEAAVQDLLMPSTAEGAG